MIKITDKRRGTVSFIVTEDGAINILSKLINRFNLPAIVIVSALKHGLKTFEKEYKIL